MDQTQKLRLKLPDGAEFEAEGSTDFIRAERLKFLSSLKDQASAPAAAPGAPRSQAKAAIEPELAWDAMIERKGQNIHLRAKLPADRSQKDACLVLLIASQKLLHQPRPTAAQLAKWLRVSG
ncbi:MAG: hypothetical protein PHU21_09075, partial [Elusimicrobia bacterium]|nr:hypothetical protein [Elusimicrobiota bacterium]